MNNLLSLIHASRNGSDSGILGSAESMLSELLTLHEDMIAQLRLERLRSLGTTEFIGGMIEQHEHAAAMLRAQLEPHRAIPFQPFSRAS